jgi:molybdopterin converting factor small subunit
LPRLIRATNIRHIFAQYNTSKLIEIGMEVEGRRRSLRIYIREGLRLELNSAEVPIKEGDGAQLFTYNGKRYQADVGGVMDVVRALEEKVLARLYGFDRFKDDVVNSMLNGVEAEAPKNLLREDGKNFGAVAAAKHVEVLGDLNAELKELGQVEVALLDDGRVVMLNNHIAAKPPESLLRTLYYLVALSSATFFTKLHGLEGRMVLLLEDPEVHPRLLHLLVSYVAKFVEVGRVVIATNNPVLVSLLKDKFRLTLYYVYRGSGGLTEVVELDNDKLTRELATTGDILLMKLNEVLRFARH